jgi:hypothetical protein
MDEYMALFEENEMMKEIYERKARASETLTRFWDDIEGYNRYVTEEVARVRAMAR